MNNIKYGVKIYKVALNIKIKNISTLRVDD